MNLFIAVIVLSLLILVHELGHFLVAKGCGIRVLEFSMFMGPKLFSFRKGETLYVLRLIPMGGYVKMEGEEVASDDPRAFNRQKIWKRFLVVSAGPVMNVALAFLLMTAFTLSTGVMTNRLSVIGPNSPFAAVGMKVGDKLLSWNGRTIHDLKTDITMFLYGAKGAPVAISWESADGLQRNSELSLYKTAPVFRLGFSPMVEGDIATNIIDVVEPDSPIQVSGLKRGDRIVKIDDREVSNRDEIVAYINGGRGAGNPAVALTVLRDGQSIVFRDITPFVDSYYTIDAEFVVEKVGFFGALAASGRYSSSTIRTVLTTVGWLFTGTIGFKDVSGPVGIVGVIGSVVEREPALKDKLLSMASLGALLSLNLGVMNLIPFPALDGSKLALLLIEKIRRRPLPPEKEGLISLIGFSLLIILLVATLFNDIPRWIL
jgi:regulator of sigma E protease